MGCPMRGEGRGKRADKNGQEHSHTAIHLPPPRTPAPAAASGVEVSGRSCQNTGNSALGACFTNRPIFISYCFLDLFPQRESSHMPLDEATLQRQLDLAKAELAVWVKKLDTKKVASNQRRKDATWRKLNAACNTIKTRMKAAAAVKTRDEAVAQHKIEKLSAAVT